MVKTETKATNLSGPIHRSCHHGKVNLSLVHVRVEYNSENIELLAYCYSSDDFIIIIVCIVN